MSLRPLALGALTVLELAPDDMVICAAEAGYAYVGLRILPATPTEVTWPSIGDTPLVRNIERRLADTGVRVLDIEIFRLLPKTEVRAFVPALETGARLGATQVLVAGNDPDPVRLADRFAALCDLGAPLRLTLNVEPMPWTEVKNVDQGLRLLVTAARPNAGLLIDPIHFDRGGNVPADIAAIPRERLFYMQLCDAPAERPRDTETLIHQARNERLMPGDGALDLEGILRAMPRDIPIALEVPMRTLAQSVGAVERATRMRAKTEALLATL
ncbi:MAG TPA: sugar phosphate isomerase/epimerase [Burkholderiales bacterium]|nr:sugar phosphate isomerase/epimerase [Burkholderiales bacterium]